MKNKKGSMVVWILIVALIVLAIIFFVAKHNKTANMYGTTNQNTTSTVGTNTNTSADYTADSASIDTELNAADVTNIDQGI